MLLVQLLLTLLKEKTTRKGSKNSGLPSSQTSRDETASGKSGTKGKGPDPKIHDNAHIRKVTETTLSAVTECSGCGRDIAGVACSGHEKRTPADLVFEIRTEHGQGRNQDLLRQAKLWQGESSGKEVTEETETLHRTSVGETPIP